MCAFLHASDVYWLFVKYFLPTIFSIFFWTSYSTCILKNTDFIAKHAAQFGFNTFQQAVRENYATPFGADEFVLLLLKLFFSGLDSFSTGSFVPTPSLVALAAPPFSRFGLTRIFSSFWCSPTLKSINTDSSIGVCNSSSGNHL